MNKMMTPEEAKEILENWNLCHYTPSREAAEMVISALDPLEIISALRPVSRKQVEQMRGEWIVKHDKYNKITTAECSKCGDETMYEFFFEENDSNFCPHCGTPMTDEAMEMVMLRLEALKDG